MALFGRFWTEKLNYLIKKVFDKMKLIYTTYQYEGKNYG